VTQSRADEFGAFYLRERDGCLRAAIAIGMPLETAEDAVAEAFSRAWADWSRLRRHPAPAAWVVRTASNLNISWWRRRRREIALPDHDARAAVPDPGVAAHEGHDATILAAVRASLY
jgi:RNA polymerase sigma-70 factor (ECF subfamily)